MVSSLASAGHKARKWVEIMGHSSRRRRGLNNVYSLEKHERVLVCLSVSRSQLIPVTDPSDIY